MYLLALLILLIFRCCSNLQVFIIKELKIFFFNSVRKEFLCVVILFLMNLLDCGKFSAELDIQFQVIWMPFQAPELACSKVLCVATASLLIRGDQQQVAQTKLYVTHQPGF